MESPSYLKWVVEETNIKLSDETIIPCYRLDYTKDEDILNEWAIHLRRHYISDQSLSDSAEELGISKAEYLENFVLPNNIGLGAACRSGDFTEIIVADLLEYIHHYTVPRFKQKNRVNKDRSTQGSDVFGYKYEKGSASSINDELIIAEVKGLLSSKSYDVLREAAEHSRKDEFRWATTLDFYRKKCHDNNHFEEARKIARFLRKPEEPFHLHYWGVGVTSIETIEHNMIPDFTRDDLFIDTEHGVYLIHGSKLLDLEKDLFARCMR